MKNNVLFIFIIIGWLLHPLDVSGKKKKPSIDFWPIEESIQRLFKEIRETKDDSLAIRLHQQIEDILAQTLAYPSAYKHKFDSLRTIGRLYAPHKAFRMFNWNHSMRDGTHQYFALIVIPSLDTLPNKIIRLTDMSDSIVKPEQQILGADKWFGVLYYKIISPKKGKDGKKYYTLLGLDMNNLQTKKKIIEILSFNEKGEPQFGAPIIELNGWTKNRVIFEFGASQGMYLEYKCFKRMIVFDHLAPPMPYLVGEYEYYEPDMYRDGLKFKKGHWKHYKEIQTPPKHKKVKKRNLPKPPKPKPPLKPVKEEVPQEDIDDVENEVIDEDVQPLPEHTE